MPRRTQACEPCRKRRMKCDETRPQCVQCQRARRDCPGPQEGPIIVDMTQDVGARWSKSLMLARNTSAVRLVASPALGPAAMEAYYGHFLAFFLSTSGGKIWERSWMCELPALASRSDADALRLSLQATSAAFCAIRAADVALICAARDVYGKALTAHRKALMCIGSTSDLRCICTSLLLSFFEAMDNTSPHAYREHSTAAAMLLSRAGPEKCADGIMNQLFHNVRAQMTCLSVADRTRPMFASQAYLSIPYRPYHQDPELPVFERMMHVILVLSECYADQEQLGSQDPLQAQGAVRVAEAAIEVLAQEYTARALEKGERLWWDDPIGTKYRDVFTALTLAYFDAARVMSSIVAPRLPNPLTENTTDRTVESHCASILSAANFLASRSIGCSYLRMTLPLLLVAVHSSSEIQRQSARSLYQSWNAAGTVRGLWPARQPLSSGLLEVYLNLQWSAETSQTVEVL